MKKSFLLVPAVLLTLAFVAWRANETLKPLRSGVDRNKQLIAGSQVDGLKPGSTPQSVIETKDRGADPEGLALAHHHETDTPKRDSAAIPNEQSGARSDSPVAAISSQVSMKPLDVSGPSIGSVKVLGHRGCDTNTQGWYLGKGAPDQYEYTESDDEETLVVQPNVQNLTGAFEFVRCVDRNQIAGKHIQFRVRLKAQDVKDIAQLRFWGENANRERILFKSEKVTGTYDWKDFTIEGDVDPEVTLFNYGITFRSSGKLWVSHPVFSVSP